MLLVSKHFYFGYIGKTSDVSDLAFEAKSARDDAW